MLTFNSSITYLLHFRNNIEYYPIPSLIFYGTIQMQRYTHARVRVNLRASVTILSHYEWLSAYVYQVLYCVLNEVNVYKCLTTDMRS